MRIRSIKPEFWASENMAQLTRDERLVFIGLWSLADDEGRFRANPRYIAGQVLPYDDDGIKVATRALASLREQGAVALYEVGGSQYGQVTGWSRHQKIDRPSQSKIPQPPEISLANIREPSSSPREASCEEQGTGNREQGWEQGGTPPTPIRSDVETLRQRWNELTSPPIPRWTTGRDDEAAKALKRRPMSEWEEVFRRINASPFCRGETEGGWKADIDWVLRPKGKKPETAMKVLEGAYDRGPPRLKVANGPIEPATTHTIGDLTNAL